MKTTTPRRINLELNVPAELAIRNAMIEVEKIGADVKLTEAVILLQKAKDLVSDFIDKACDHDYECTLDTDTWSSYTCKRCGDSKIQDFE